MKIREQLLRERVKQARAIARLNGEALGIPHGEQDWAAMYAQDVEPLRRLLADMVIADAARALTDRPQRFVPLLAARVKAQKFLGGRQR